ncbi:hypothetical protein Tco_0425192, partial [Tanacetum coccineum]
FKRQILNSLEIWSFEMMVLLSGLLRNPQLETLVLCIRFTLLSDIQMFITKDEVAVLSVVLGDIV